MTERHELWQVLDALQMDLRAASAKLVEVRARVSSLDLPDATNVPCPHCTRKLTGPRALAEHLYNLHDGPEPAHYAEIAARAIDPDEEAA